MRKSMEEKAWFCGMIQMHQGALFKTAFGVLQNEEDAEDAVQEAIFTAYEKLDTLRAREKFKPWLMKILIRSCYEIIRRRHHTVSLDEYEDQAQEKDNWVENMALWQAVGRLSQELRAVVVLFYYEDMSVREIGRILNISESAVKTRLTRARQNMRLFLAEGERNHG
jgi:RNA polymerase sigma-70 factor (ECF subfamily)